VSDDNKAAPVPRTAAQLRAEIAGLEDSINGSSHAALVIADCAARVEPIMQLETQRFLESDAFRTLKKQLIDMMTAIGDDTDRVQQGGAARRFATAMAKILARATGDALMQAAGGARETAAFKQGRADVLRMLADELERAQVAGQSQPAPDAPPESRPLE
jgi:hypothetical protein